MFLAVILIINAVVSVVCVIKMMSAYNKAADYLRKEFAELDDLREKVRLLEISRGEDRHE